MTPGLPYTPSMIAAVLRDMPADRLAVIAPEAFQTWPTRQIVKRAVVADLIDAERASRRVVS